MVGHHSGAVNDAGVDVAHPRAVHDRQGAQDQHTSHVTALHEVVCSPQCAQRLAGAGVVETECAAVQREEAGRLGLVCHGLVAPGPVVAPNYGGRRVLHAEIAQHAHLIQPPVHRHFVRAAVLREHLVLWNDAVLVRIACAQHKRLVVNDLHYASSFKRYQPSKDSNNCARFIRSKASE